MQNFLITIILVFSFNTWAWEPPKSLPSKEDLKKTLTSIQYSVTQDEDTERPFKNEYWDNKEDGIYVDIVSGEPLFSSKDKFDSGTGWPSFTQPLQKENIVTKVDKSLFSTRTEVRSRIGNSHLGHVFEDGPKPTGLRYCMNSAALRFIPKEKMQQMGYGEYLNTFSSSAFKTFVVAAGCFWCIQPPYDKLAGVVSTKVGYTGGQKLNPTYEEVSAGSTGHLESIEVTYDPTKVTVEKLLDVFWHNIDPYDDKGQFCDKGEQYTSAFFFQTEDEKKLFEKSKDNLIQKKLLKPTVTTKLLAAKTFFAAEDYHQSYYTKNPVRYKYYRYRCGRDQRLKEVWEKK